MSKAPAFSAELHKLCGRLRDGEITDAESRRLCEMLLASRGARRFYRTFMALTSALETRTTLQDAVDGGADSDKNIEDLFELLHQEQEAEVLPLTRGPRKEKLAWHEISGLTGYLFFKAMKSGPAKWLAAAAALLLGVVLVIVFLTGGPDDRQPIVEAPGPMDEPVDEPVIDVQPVVATLTDELDAQWRATTGADLPGVGEGLHAGQQLVLVSGLAEITTNRGAVAVIEAPATVELINHNAIRLLAGKLVGIYETEQSKGFLVRTPHMDITGIGTRFGVDASNRDATQVHVIEGVVEYSTPLSGSDRLALQKGQSIAVDGYSGLKQVEFAPNRFVMDRELEARQIAEQSQWARSLAHRYERARVGGVLLDLFFEEEKAGGVRASSIANHSNPLRVHADGLVPGRFGEHTAVRLNNKDHFVQASIDEPQGQITVAGWYYIDALDNHITSLAHSESTGGLHWHITRAPNNTATIGLIQMRERGLPDWSDARSDAIVQASLTGQWIHLAVTLDVAGGQAAIYLNGRGVAKGNADDFVPITLGTFQIGNWQPGERHGPITDPIRSLRGAVDEFVVISRSLSSEQVLELYRSKLP